MHGPGARLTHRLEHFLFRRVLDGLARRSLDEAVRRGARLGGVWHSADRRHRRLAEENIRRGLGVAPAEAARIARECFQNLGRTVAEFACFATHREELLDRVEVEGFDHVQAALERGKGILFLTGHCGCWELLAAKVATRVPLTSLAKPMRNPLVDALIESRRAAGGSRTLHYRQSAREVLGLLQRNETVGVLLDQSAMRREGVFVPFLGRPASANHGLAVLALKSGTPVIPGFIAREGENRHRVRIGPPVPPAEEGDRRERIGVTTARYTAAIEAYVRRHPQEWFWVHDRWKREPLPGDRVYSP